MTDEGDADGWKKWRGLIAFGVVAAALFGASRIDAARPYEAMIVAMGFPLAVCVAGLMPLRDAAGTLRAAAVVVALVAIAAAELELSEVFFPGAPVATASLSSGARDARVAWPSEGRPLELQVRGELRDPRGAAQGTYVIVLSRGDDETSVAGRLSRTVNQARPGQRRGAPVTTVVTHLTDRHQVTLRGRGPVRAHLDEVDGLRGSIELTLREPPRMDRAMMIALAVTLLLGAVVEAAAAKVGYRTRLTGAVGATAVLAWYVVHRFDVDDPLLTVIAGVLVAGLAGGLGGMLLGKIAAMLVVRSPPARSPAG